jgi:hypothetical protein
MLEAEGGNTGASYSLTDAIGIGTLTRLVPRELVDEVVASLGRKELRRNKLPARVMVYFVMAMALFHGDAYEEVMRKLAGGLQYLGTWRREWKMPSPGGLCQARQRLGPEVMRELYERVSVPCAMRSTAGAWLAGRRLMAIDGFGMEAPDSEENAAYFGYAGKKGRSAFPFVRMAALALIFHRGWWLPLSAVRAAFWTRILVPGYDDGPAGGPGGRGFHGPRVLLP